eukprot:TRINITY_DN8280_c0_g2_i1.p1 TRINITY_DN8280_c0_g2~~TRINITY_DN8280_c0_g2_i1.p1  ORF type:complete len:429 (+),score=76.48 TRINITY_DN8280_c0_g2_i1:120-1289(+)
MSNLDPQANVPVVHMELETKIIKINPKTVDSDEDDFRFPVELLQRGEVVAFPTETVYGLGANALSSSAVSKIFSTKMRPFDNPLIVHVSNREMLRDIVAEIPKEAHQLIERFWPGPLTILFPKSPLVPNEYVCSLFSFTEILKRVVCGQPTVAIRMPNHPVALKLISLANVPIAAPSANLSGRPSPTTADHVHADLNRRIHCIIDGGPTSVGLESTVLDINRKLILRPGGITVEQLREYIPSLKVYSAKEDGENLMLSPPTPGLKYRHYSPSTRVLLLEGIQMDKMRNFIITKFNSLAASSKRLGILHTHPTQFQFPESMTTSKSCVILTLSDGSAPEVARLLFSALREMDTKGVDLIIMEGISEQNEGLAVMNRIRKAASQILFTDSE